MPRSLRIALLALGVASAVPLIPWTLFLARGQTPAGLRVASEPMAPTDDPHAELRARARRWGAQELTIEADDTLHRVSRAELGASVDVDAMRARVATRGRSGNPFADVPALVAAWAGETDFGWRVEVDRRRVRAYVDELAHEVDRAPRPARVARGRVLALSADGARLDRERAVDTILGALREGRRTAHLSVERLRTALGAVAVGPAPRERRPVVLGRYSTDFETRGGERSRAHNVATAAGYLDGAVIPARGRLSFNDRVGARTSERGYRIAHVIMDGEMVDGMGGGVCQVASTLHAAAFLAGFGVDEHSPHSRPSAYIPMGLDATVVWPNVDLVLLNPHDFPVTVRAFADHGQMSVELHGLDRGPRVEWNRRTLSTEAWSDRYVEDPTVTEGERITQRPIRGFTILRERVFFTSRGARVEERRLRYPPTDRVIRVPVGTLDPYTHEPLASGPTIPANPF